MIEKIEETDRSETNDNDYLKQYLKILIIYLQIIISIPLLILYHKKLSTLKQHLSHSFPQISTLFFVNIQANIVNLYWKGIFNRKTVFTIKSFLYQTKLKWQINLWTGNGTIFIDNAAEQLNLLQVQIKPFLYEKEIKNTPFEVFKTIYPWEYNKVYFRIFSKIAIESDWIRLILLYNYSGLYFDLDILFLKPPEDIIAKYKEFVCPWGVGSLKNTNNNLIYLSRKNIIKLCESAIKEKKPNKLLGIVFFKL